MQLAASVSGLTPAQRAGDLGGWYSPCCRSFQILYIQKLKISYVHLRYKQANDADLLALWHPEPDEQTCLFLQPQEVRSKPLHGRSQEQLRFGTANTINGLRKPCSLRSGNSGNVNETDYSS